MSTETAVKTGVAATIAVFSTFIGDIFKQVFGLLIVLLAFMLFDWITGTAKANKSKMLSSKAGLKGILKKTVYIGIVLVACGLDYVITFSAGKIGFTSFTSVYVTILVTIWLIVNEGISILENIGELGVDYPQFLTKIFKSLKTTVEKQVKIDNETEDK